MIGYWPVWMGALAMSAVVVGFMLLFRRSFGVSGSWQRLIMIREHLAKAKLDAQIPTDEAELHAALLAATRAEFGDSAIANVAVAPSTPVARVAQGATSPLVDAMLLMGLVIGGALSAFTSPSANDLGADVAPYFGDFSTVALVLGGICVGFGTRMAGGCTSGHGLSGVSRLRRGSLIATATFFGAGIATAVIIEKVLR